MAAQSNPIKIRTDNRITIIGSTGDGKTTLALKLMEMFNGHKQKAVILNPAAEPKYYELFGDSRPDVNLKWPPLQHIAPPVVHNPKDYGSVLWPIVERGNTITLIDELAIIGEANRYSLALKYLYQMGRRRNCGAIAISQRPIDIPVFSYTMADHIFIGDVLGNDLKHIEKLTNQRWQDAIQNRGQYEFLYWSRHEKLPPRVVKI